MKEIELKILPKYFKAVQSGEKTFEIRKNDRDYEVGDTLLLRELNECTDRINEACTTTIRKGYTGQEITKEVTYILGGGEYGLEEGYCIMGLKPVGYKDILNELIEKYGFDAKEIQKTYERYMWNINYYKDAIKLKNIDLTGISLDEQSEKVKEEIYEFEVAMNEFLQEKTPKNRKHLIEEYHDYIQAPLGLLDMVGISASEVMEKYPLHERKLENRPRIKKCNKCIKYLENPNNENIFICSKDSSELKIDVDIAKECKNYKESEEQ